MQSDFFFHAPQTYLCIMEYARRLIDHESSYGEGNHMNHQIHTRIYNNAFCGLLKAGSPFKITEDKEKPFLIIEWAGIQYQCPTNSAQNILRGEYDKIVSLDIKRETTTDNSIDTKKIQEAPKRKEKGGNIASPFLTKSGLPDIDSFEFSPPPKHKIKNIEPENLSVEPENLFVPKSERFRSTKVSCENGIPENREDPEKAGLLAGIFGRKKNSGETMAPERREEPHNHTKERHEKDLKMGEVPKENLPVKHESYSQDGGVPFMHIHYITIKRRFGDEVMGNYRFIFWPTRIIEGCPKKTWGDFLLHVTNMDTQEETITCTDQKMKELIVEIDRKEFSVFSFWNGGEFESHVVLHGKTDSMFRMEEKTDKKEPNEKQDTYLDQFRYERKGQPRVFVAPFRGSNRGEQNIPILGYVEINDQKFPLERMDKNRIGYQCRGELKIIQGHWEKGRFVFTIEDGNPIEWEAYL